MNQSAQSEFRIAGRIPVPSGLHELRDPARFRQGVALAVCLLAVGFFMVILTIGFISLSILLDFSWQWEQTALISITLLVLLQLAAFYRYANIRVAAMLITTTYFLMTFTVVVFSGGYESPLIALLLCSVVVSFRFGSREDGFMSCVYVAGAVLSLVIVQVLGVPSVNLLEGLPLPALFFIGWISTLLTIVACLGTYTYDRND